MRIFAKGSHINFMAGRKIALVFSSLLVIASFVSLGTKGLNFGIDFTGGTLVEVEYASAIELSGVRSTLAEAGFKEAIVQHFGTPRNVLVRVAPREGIAQDEISVIRCWTDYDPVMKARLNYAGASLWARRWVKN